MSAPRFEWRRVARGLFWIGIGALLLLNTTGVVSWSFWIAALPYWPVLLVALGLRLVFERSRFPGLVLLSPLVILGTLGWVAFAGPHAPSGHWTDVRAEQSAEPVEWSLEGDLIFTDLSLQAAPLPGPLLVGGRTTAGRQESLRVRGSPEQPRVRIGPHERDFTLLGPSRQEHWDLRVSDAAPLTLDLDLVFTSCTLDLERARVQRVDIQGAFNSVTLRLGEVQREEDVRIHLDGAFNEFALVVPPATPVEVRTDGFLTSHRGERRAPSAGAPGYRVYLDGAASRVDVRSDGLPPGF